MRNILLAVVLVASLAVVPVGVLGQQTTPNATATPTPAASTSTPAPERSIIGEIDPTTALVDSEYRNGTFFLTLDLRTPTRVVITDSAKAMELWEDGGEGAGGGSLNARGYTLGSGKTTIEYPATRYDGAAAVTIATSRGVFFHYSEGIERRRPAVPWGQVIALIGLAGFGTAYVTHRRVEGKYEDEDKEAERIA